MKSQSAAKLYKQSALDDKLIGKTFNNIKVLSLSHVEKSRRFYNIKCLRCNTSSYMRSDRFTGTQKLNTCRNCRQENAILTSKKRATPESVYSSLYAHYKKGAITRSITFLISLEEFKNIIAKNCYYCGSEPKLSGTSKRYNKTHIQVKHNGVDRVDNSMGYTLDNCVPCCNFCNHMKRDYSKVDFLSHIKKIYVYNEGSTTIPEGSTSQANGDGNRRVLNGEHDIV
jgi:hypothetical protein